MRYRKDDRQLSAPSVARPTVNGSSRPHARCLSSEGWQRWVRVRSTNGLSRYSFGNQLLIAMQRPDATYVAGFRAFLELNRCVRKGERAIRILAPMSVRRERTASTQRRKPRRGASTRGERFPRRVGVRRLTDRPATRTPSRPLDSAVEPIEGDSHAHLLPAARAARGRARLHACIRRPLEGPADGWCDSASMRSSSTTRCPRTPRSAFSSMRSRMPSASATQDYGRHRAEVLVDTVTFIVCGSVGLDTSGSSVPYVAGWGESGELDAIRAYAETIDKIARRIEDSLRDESQVAQVQHSLAA